jgi:hypothetical protein
MALLIVMTLLAVAMHWSDIAESNYALHHGTAVSDYVFT